MLDLGDVKQYALSELLDSRLNEEAPADVPARSGRRVVASVLLEKEFAVVEC